MPENQLVGKKGLTRVRGHSYEDLIRILEERDIPYRVKLKTRRGNQEYFGKKYFRYSEIEINEKSLAELGDLEDKHSSAALFELKGYFFYAVYKVELEFDMSQLDGPITFRRGHLVEKTLVGYVPRRS